MKKFITVINNVNMNDICLYSDESIACELIPVECLLKIYQVKGIGENWEKKIICYSFEDPVMHTQRDFYRMIRPEEFRNEWEKLESMLQPEHYCDRI